MRIRPFVPALLLCAAPAAWAEPCRLAAVKGTKKRAEHGTDELQRFGGCGVSENA